MKAYTVLVFLQRAGSSLAKSHIRPASIAEAVASREPSWRLREAPSSRAFGSPNAPWVADHAGLCRPAAHELYDTGYLMIAHVRQI